MGKAAKKIEEVNVEDLLQAKRPEQQPKPKAKPLASRPRPEPKTQLNLVPDITSEETEPKTRIDLFKDIAHAMTELNQMAVLEHEASAIAAEAKHFPIIDVLNTEVEKNFESLIYYVKDVLKALDNNTLMELQFIGQYLSEKQLVDLRKGLTIEESINLKAALAQTVVIAKYGDVIRRIINNIKKYAIMPKISNDPELMALLSDMNLEKTMIFMGKSKAEAPYLLNLLPSRILAQLINKMPAEQISDIVQKSNEVKWSDLSAKLGELKLNLKQLFKTTPDRPFNSVIKNVIQDMPPEKEKIIYEQLVQNKQEDFIMELAQTCFPSHLVSGLPKPALREMTKNMPVPEKVVFLASLEQTERDVWINIFSDPETKSREMINMELETITANEAEMNKIKKIEQIYLKKVIDFVRQEIRSANSFGEYKGIVLNWIENAK